MALFVAVIWVTHNWRGEGMPFLNLIHLCNSTGCGFLNSFGLEMGPKFSEGNSLVKRLGMLDRKFELGHESRPTCAWLELYFTPERYRIRWEGQHFLLLFCSSVPGLKDTFTVTDSAVSL